MNADHDRIEELFAARALGGIGPQDDADLERLRAAHGGCPTCERLEAETAAVAGRLAFALDPVPVDTAVAERILAHAATGAQPPRRAAPSTTSRRRIARRTPPRAIGAVAAAVAAAAVVVALLIVAGPGSTRTTAVFAGGPGRLAMTFSPGVPGLHVAGDLPSLSPDRVYELWTIRNGTPIRTACFRPTSGAVDVTVDRAVRTGDTMAVTVEGSSCPTAPTGRPVMTAALRA